MALMQSRQRSQLAETAETRRLLDKIAALFAQKAARLVFEKSGVRFNASECANVALDFSLVSGNIVFRRPPAADQAGQRTIQDITYTGAAGNATDNSVTIAYVDDGTAGSETVTVVGTAITVHMEAGVSTATQIKAAFDLSAPATALASAAITGTAGDAQDAQSATALLGGVTKSSLETYDTADILMVKRLRTKKYLIVIKDAANPA